MSPQAVTSAYVAFELDVYGTVNAYQGAELNGPGVLLQWLDEEELRVCCES